MKFLIAAVLICWSTAAMSQACGRREIIVEQLKTKYQEELIGFGFQTANNVLELWRSKKKAHGQF